MVLIKKNTDNDEINEGAVATPETENEPTETIDEPNSEEESCSAFNWCVKLYRGFPDKEIKLTFDFNKLTVACKSMEYNCSMVIHQPMLIYLFFGYLVTSCVVVWSLPPEVSG